VSGV
jgi:hypothetical protein